jgi:hypothetical protein
MPPFLAAHNRRSENVCVFAVIIAELELGNIERKVLFADLVKGADHATLNQRPEALDSICVKHANHVFALGVIDGDVLGKFLIQVFVTDPLIGHEQANLVRHGFMHKAFQCDGAHVFNDAGDNIALAANCASDHGLARSGPASAIAAPAIMSVFGFSTDESLVHLDNTAEFFNVAICERNADTMAHVPSRLIGPETHETEDLQRAHALLAGQHEVNNAEPIFEGLIRVLKDRAGKVREAIRRGGRANVALPMPRITLQLSRLYSATARAMDAFWPPLADQIGTTGLLIRKGRVELSGGQLVDVLSGGHGLSLSMEEICHA